MRGLAAASCCALLWVPARAGAEILFGAAWARADITGSRGPIRPAGMSPRGAISLSASGPGALPSADVSKRIRARSGATHEQR